MKPSPPSVNVARLLYLVLCELAGLGIALSSPLIELWMGLAGGLFLAAFFIFVEALMKGFTLRGFSTATFGLAVGLFCAFLLNRVGIGTLVQEAVTPFGEEPGDLGETLALALNVAIYASLGFIGATLALRSSQEDFSFIIPYVRFRQDAASGQPLLLDAEVIVDGRVGGLMIAGFFTGRLIVPQFVLDELQVMANSPSPGKRQRGQRGLEVLQEMQDNPGIPISIHDASGVAEDESLQGRLVQTAKLLGARIVTTDENLTKVAHLQGAGVINLNDLADSLRPAVVVGEKVRLALVRTGKDDHQGVGYMSDGTMIVVNHAVSRIGTTQEVVVISTLKTSGGELVFAELAENVGETE
ncbi:MAG: PIN/TRAM domain-containing protein [Verrucomicrobiaceae bacterium]